MRALALLLILHGWALAQTGGDAFKTPFSLSCSGAAILPRRSRINLTGSGVSGCVDNAAANRTDVTITGGGLGGGMTSFSLAGDSGTPQPIMDSDVLTIAGGAGIATTASATDTVSIATASQEAGFIADGATTDLTCGSSAQGKVETRDDGLLEWCDGGTTSVLRRAAFGDASGVATSATVLAANGTNCSSGTYPLGVDASGNAESCGSAINGNAGTATAFAANPVDCSASQYATTIGANGDLTCATIPFSDISGVVTDAQVPNTITINLAATATALAANPANCGSGLAAGVDASGVAEGCSTNIATATALAANGSNCSAGSFPLGVDASGASESCTTLASSNVGTATALAANGANCSANQAAGGVDASGASESCVAPLLTPGAVTTNALVKFSGTGGQATAQSACVESAGTITGCALTGNASTATALAANGANCSAGSFPLGVDASGASEGCTALSASNTGTATALAANGTNCSAGSYPLGVDASGNAESCGTAITGNAGTATALAANGGNCSAGSFPLGVDASGASESCTALSASNAGTATALAANGTNCSAGSFPLGVDASGNSESCTVATTGTVTSVASGAGLTGGTITSTGTLAFAYTDTLAGNPAMNAGECRFGTTGLLCEGSTADTIEMLLTVADPTASDKTITLPNETGTVCTTGSVCTGYQAGPLTSDVTTSGAVATIANLAVTGAKMANDTVTATQLAAAVELPAACTTSGQLVKSNGAGPTWGCQSQGSGNSLDADTVDGLHAASFDLASSSANTGGRAFLQANAGGL